MKAVSHVFRWLRAAWHVGPSRASWVAAYEQAWQAEKAKR